MIITKDSHVDHGLGGVHIELLFQLFGARDAFFIETVPLKSPTAGFPLPPLPCLLYGPIMGDGPVPEALTTWAQRGEREWEDRCIIAQATVPLTGTKLRGDTNWKMREDIPQAPGYAQGRVVKTMTVIAGPNGGHACILYTAFGGPLAPKGINDPSLLAAERQESETFWAEHALLVPGRP
jgi:hypothetical protein